MPMRNSILFLLLLFIGSPLFAQEVHKVGLLARWDNQDLLINGTARFNECWGFTMNGGEYAVMGSTEGAHFIEITRKNEAIERSFVRGAHVGTNVVHRDFAIYRNYCYAVCQQGNSSLQVIDLSPLPDSTTVVYDDSSFVTVAHNVWVDTFTAKLYVCGPQGHAMSVYSLADPTTPTLISHFDEVDYVHDVYIRRDTAYLNAANQGLWVYDFTDATDPTLLGNLEFYSDQGYNHSGWLTPDGKTYVFADETTGRRMKVCDVTDLTDIDVQGLFNSGVHPETVPHNLMIKGRFVYVSHYNDGLRIFDISDPENVEMVAWYDTYQGSDETAHFKGAWGVYPFLPSGKILISDRQSGLWVFKFEEPPLINSPLDHGVFPNPMNDLGYFYFDNPIGAEYRMQVYDATGRLVQRYGIITENYFKIFRASLPDGVYMYELEGVNIDRFERGKFIIQR